jgi:hypothetical protein
MVAGRTSDELHLQHITGNLVVRRSENRTRIFAADSLNGRIVTADLDEQATGGLD